MLPSLAQSPETKRGIEHLHESVAQGRQRPKHCSWVSGPGSNKLPFFHTHSLSYLNTLPPTSVTVSFLLAGRESFVSSHLTQTAHPLTLKPKYFKTEKQTVRNYAKEQFVTTVKNINSRVNCLVHNYLKVFISV